MKQYFKNTLEDILNTIPEGYSETALQRICLQITFKALQGDFKSINFIRDTIGQAPFKEMLINEFMLNPEIEKTKSFLIDLSNDDNEATTTARNVAIALMGNQTIEEVELKDKLFEKCLKLYGREKILDFIQDRTDTFTNIDDLASILFDDTKGEEQ